MARDDDPGPRPLSWSLRLLAARVERVDLVGFAAVEAAWGEVCAASASCATPVRLSNGELTVATPGDGVRIQTCISAAAGACTIDL